MCGLVLKVVECNTPQVNKIHLLAPLKLTAYHVISCLFNLNKNRSVKMTW